MRSDRNKRSRRKKGRMQYSNNDRMQTACSSQNSNYRNYQATTNSQCNSSNNNNYVTQRNYTPRDAGFGYSEKDLKRAEAKQKVVYRDGAKPVKVKKSKGKKVFKAIIIILIIIALIAAGIGVYGYKFIDDQIKKLDYVNTSNKDIGINSRVASQLSDYQSIAFLGVDHEENEDPNNARSDAIIVMTINKKTGKVAITSLMRDTYLPMLYSDKATEILHKATHAHSYGGPVNTITMLNKSLDLNIDKFVVFSWEAVVDLVDSMGGITVEIEENELADLNETSVGTALATEHENYNKVTKAGTQTIDGVTAATYCRIRQTSGGDQGRTSRMRKVLTAVFNDLKSNPKKLVSMGDKVFPQIKTNMDTNDILALAPILLKMNIEQSVLFPYNYYGGIVNEAKGWIAVPTTLEENVKKLHKELFGQNDYTLTNTAQEINEWIIDDTGITVGEPNE